MNNGLPYIFSPAIKKRNPGLREWSKNRTLFNVDSSEDNVCGAGFM